MPGILRRTRVYLEFTLRPPGYFVDFLNFASDFAPDQLSDSGKLASFQNGAPNTLCFPWKFPETQSAGDPLFSFLFAGKSLFSPRRNPASTGTKRGTRRIPSCGNVVSLKRCDTAGECQVPIWASSIGPSRHALLAGGLLGHGTSGEISQVDGGLRRFESLRV